MSQLDLKSMLPMLMMMNGGGNNADMLKMMSEMGNGEGGGKSPQELLPLFMSMFNKGNQNGNSGGNNGGTQPARDTAADSRGNPEFSADRPAQKAQFFAPILDFANEKIIYNLSMMLC